MLFSKKLKKIASLCIVASLIYSQGAYLPFTAGLYKSSYENGFADSLEESKVQSVVEASYPNPNVSVVKDAYPDGASGITGVEDGKVYNSDIIIKFSTGTATLDGKELSSGAKVREEGTHVITYIDSNENKSTINFEIDKTPPVVEGIMSGSDYKENLVITFNEGLGKLFAIKDGDEKLMEEGVKSPKNITEEGRFKFVVEDKAANVNETTFNVDKTPPKYEGVADGVSYKEPVTIKVESELLSGKLNGTPLESTEKTISEDGKYVLALFDWAGNKSEVTFYVDKAGKGLAEADKAAAQSGSLSENTTVTSAGVENTPETPVPAVDLSPKVEVKAVVVEEKAVEQSLTKAIEDKNSAIPGVEIQPVTIDVSESTEKNAGFVLTGDKINKIAENALDVKIVSNDTSISLDSGMVANDIAAHKPKEVIFSKASIEDNDSKELRKKMETENPEGELITPVKDFNLQIKDQDDNLKKIESFSERVKVDIKLSDEELKKINNKENVAIYNLLPNGEYDYVGGSLSGNSISFEAKHFSFYVVMENNKTFNDITNSWAKKEIELLASRNIIKGDAEKKAYDPKGTITRGQFAVMISKVLGFRPEKYSAVFKDVKDKKFYSGYVLSAFKNGVIKGDGASAGDLAAFRPDDIITREQMATITITAMKNYNPKLQTKTLNGKLGYNDDKNISEFAMNSIANVKEFGIMSGFPDNTFKPKQALTREEAAKVIVKLMESAKMM